MPPPSRIGTKQACAAMPPLLTGHRSHPRVSHASTRHPSRKSQTSQSVVHRRQTRLPLRSRAIHQTFTPPLSPLPSSDPIRSHQNRRHPSNLTPRYPLYPPYPPLTPSAPYPPLTPSAPSRTLDPISELVLIQVTGLVLRRNRQVAFVFRRWGGARAGAGRRPKGASAGVSHLRRPAHSRHHPLHVTLKIVRGVPSLRGNALFKRVRAALSSARERFGFRLVHFSVQSNHLHLIAEAADRRALSRGVQGLTIRVARAVNRQLDRKGRLFVDRYHARALKTPRACSLALRYVLLNARKHAIRNAPGQGLRGQSLRGHVGTPAAPHAGFVDACSSAPWFARFARPRELAFGAAQCRAEFLRATGLVSPVVEPRVWLLRAGLSRTRSFDLDEVPG